MTTNNRKQALLLLEDGTLFEGKAIGKIGTSSGEICFNTGMTGYQEIFTDPSYFGQLMLMTNVHIGNYGVNEFDIESGAIQISGLICRDFSNGFSRKAASESLENYLTDRNCVGISNIDTRALVRHIREKGAMNAIISSEILDRNELEKRLSKVPSMEGLELASKVSTMKKYSLTTENAKFKVSVLDFGVKKNILNCLLERACEVHVFPHNTSFEELSAIEPDGYFLSNGPGDPSAMKTIFKTVKNILDSGKPVFGICLGHQIIAETMGAKTFKMHNGHRGINHPVKNLVSGKCEVTSQNHGFAVEKESLNGIPEIEITHMNLNDDTVEGMRIKDKAIFSVQYHPEASPGPHDSRYLFDEFVENMQSMR
jgi:carbamoyl-phosphate synthase small subunit